MKLQCKKRTIFNMILWGLIGITSFILLVSVIFEEEIAFYHKIYASVSLLAVAAFCVVMIWSLVILYRHHIVVDENEIVTVNYGLIRGKRKFPLSDLEKIIYKRYNLIFQIKNRKNIIIDLYYIKPQDGNEFVSWLRDKGVAVEFGKKKNKEA